jgi:hypothetical protein
MGPADRRIMVRVDLLTTVQVGLPTQVLVVPATPALVGHVIQGQVAMGRDALPFVSASSSARSAPPNNKSYMDSPRK